MATNPVDPIVAEAEALIASRPELRERLDRAAREIATGTAEVYSHEQVAKMLGLEDELEDDDAR